MRTTLIADDKSQSGGSECCSAAKGAAGETKQHSVSAGNSSVSDQKEKNTLMHHQNWFVI